ncbi:hypothetical protein PP180_04765 [Muricauda sp. SK9]|uniref:hypothetical protein n=1 Tax=Flavobacteriaceae TaxID=49546 RepID=UPI0011C4A706|nr:MULTISPECIES: hypothetical protein [Allomuricauda]MDC6384662.1 hypothetical protein [Muricauda sp. SK9]
MKLTYAVVIILLMSCNQRTKEEKRPEVIENEQDKKATHLESMINNQETTLSFVEVIALTKTKELPHIDTTNFDRFIEEEDIKKVDTRALSIEKIYPDFYAEASRYRAMDSYKVALSPDFHTVVVTFRKGDFEMESTLINYDLEGNIIDHQLIAYDEVAEGMSRIESRISGNKITMNRIFWTEKKEIEQEEFSIKDNGKIEALDSRSLSETLTDYTMVLSVLKTLGLHPLEVKTDLIVSKTWNQYPGSEIVVIPEIVDEGEHFFELNTHIAIVDNQTGNITHRFFESVKTNQWVSDAVVLKEIKIDTAPYQLSEEKMAFGIRVHYYGMSRANPYENETLSLFVKSGGSLQKVLTNYSVIDYGGEWDTNCQGEFMRTGGTLILSEERTNGWFDILAKSKITKTKNEENENGECVATETTSTETIVLKFNGEEYKTE